LRIAVNTRLLLSGRLDGIGWFTFHTLQRITKAHPEVEFIFLFDRPWSKEFIFSKNVSPVALFPQARHPFLYFLWFEFSVPAALKKYKADIFLSPDGYLSLSTNVPQLAVIHDLNFEHYPNDLPFLTRLYYRHFFPLFAKKAKRIATVSEFSRQDIVSTYGIPASKIDVVYNGVNQMYQPQGKEKKINTRNKYSNGAEYFLFVGMLHRRKNITSLLLAFDEFKRTIKSDVKLLIVGHKKWWTAEMEKAFNSMNFKTDVIFMGRQPLETLVDIVAASTAMIYVSSFEGFGVPVIEAMQCGVPVITSNVTAMPEVSGGAALLVDPFDIKAISTAMERIYTDVDLREKLSSAGIEQSKKFNWDEAADQLWNCIKKTIE
jgi:glycosyltransferase involved in cell wall biosynthesis